MPVEKSDRLKRLPPYLFAEMERKKKALVQEGRDVIDLGIGDPDRPPPERLLKALTDHLHDGGIHQYSSTQGLDSFRDAVTRWLRRRYDVALERGQICMAIGSKELIAHAPSALTNPGDVVLCPEPGYPPYRGGTVLALCEPHIMPLEAKNRFLPDLDAVPADVAKRAKILYVNYPNNPTGATADAAFYEKVVAFAKKHDVAVIADAAYAELFFDENNKPMSFLEVPGATEVGVEVHSMTKTFNMAGWRVAWAAGNPQIVEALRAFKSNVDSGQFMGFQKATEEVLERGEEDMKAIRKVYRGRRDVMVKGLRRLGWEVPEPQATFYIWFPVPGGGSSMEFADRMMEKANVVATPGIGFGKAGEGYLRIALTVEEARLSEAVDRLARL